MFSYQPNQSRAGEYYRDGLIAQGQYAAQADLDMAQRRHNAIVDGAGMVGDAAKTAVGFAMGGPAGAAMASGMGGGGGAGGGGGGTGGLLDTFVQLYGAKESGKALDKAMGMAADEGLVTYDTLEKFTNLPWQQKAPVFDLWRTSMLPVQTNRMKVQDQAQIWGDYRGAGGGGPSGPAGGFYVQ
jgi:hypothetical protein